AEKATPGRDRFADREKLEEALLDAGLRHLRVEKRDYRRRIALKDLIGQLELGGIGRFVHSMLGDEEWLAFRTRAEKVFGERFADPLVDFNDAFVVLG